MKNGAFEVGWVTESVTPWGKRNPTPERQHLYICSGVVLMRRRQAAQWTCACHTGVHAGHTSLLCISSCMQRRKKYMFTRSSSHPQPRGLWGLILPCLDQEWWCSMHNLELHWIINNIWWISNADLCDIQHLWLCCMFLIVLFSFTALCKSIQTN